MTRQAVLPWLPGYFFDGFRLRTTGVALPPTQHIHPQTGEVIYYVRPVFDTGSSIGMFIRHEGVVNWISKT